MTEQKKFRILRTAIALAVTFAIVIGCLYLPTVLADTSGERRIAQMVPIEREPLNLSSGHIQYSYSQRLQILTSGSIYYTQMDFDAMTDRYYGYRDLYLAFLSELWSLVKCGLLTRELYFTFVDVGIDQAYYYVRDFLNGGGFFVAELSVTLADGTVKLIMDLDSGHLVYLSYTGSHFCTDSLIPADFLSDSSARASFAAQYAQYLELTETQAREETEFRMVEHCETDSNEQIDIALQYEPFTQDRTGAITLCLSDMILP